MYVECANIKAVLLLNRPSVFSPVHKVQRFFGIKQKTEEISNIRMQLRTDSQHLPSCHR
jgi:hypothetical protein